MKDTSFKLDTLDSIPAFVYENSHLSKIDDKSGYDPASQQYFGIQWKGWWFVNTVLPVGWKNSPFVYQTLGMGPTSFCRELGITSALYIDD